MLREVKRGGTVLVTSIGYYPTKADPTFVREVQVTYEPVPSFKYAIFSQTALSVGSNMTVAGDIYSAGDVTIGNNAVGVGDVGSLVNYGQYMAQYFNYSRAVTSDPNATVPTAVPVPAAALMAPDVIDADGGFEIAALGALHVGMSKQCQHARLHFGRTQPYAERGLGVVRLRHQQPQRRQPHQPAQADREAPVVVARHQIGEIISDHDQRQEQRQRRQEPWQTARIGGLRTAKP